MGWHGYWASPGDWQTHHSHHPGHKRSSLSVSTPVHSSAAGECGLLPQHNEHRIRSRCSRCLTFCLVFLTPAALCWWAKNDDNNNEVTIRRGTVESIICQLFSSFDEKFSSKFISHLGKDFITVARWRCQNERSATTVKQLHTELTVMAIVPRLFVSR